MSNIETVQEIYAAFGRGDVPAILGRLGDDVRWDHWPEASGAQRHGVPWLAERTGRGEVAGFFASLAALDIHAFAPRAFLAGDGMVAAVIDLDATVVATGERIRDVEIHLWSFGADGRVTEFRHVVDTVKHVEAVTARALA
jgi:ketosteroid isomerase-like protein